MGGQDGNRGYLLQAVIAVLNSLSQADWEFVAIEPDETNQKVDIQWWDNSEKETVYQVKSSINNFDKADILNTLQELTTDVPQADQYTLVLIGTFSGDTTKFFNALSTKPAAELGNHGSIAAFKEKIRVEFRTLDIAALDGQMESKVHDFLSGRGYIVPYQTVKLIALGLHAQFARFATDGRKVARSAMESDILTWMKYNYPKELKRENERLSLAFYVGKQLVNKGPFDQNFQLPDIFQSAYFLRLKKELMELHEKIDLIKLPPPKAEPENNNTNRFFTYSSIFGPDGELSAVYEAEQILPIREKATSLLQLELPDGFFDVGQVKRVKMSTITVFIGNGPRFTGTKEEIEKRDLLSSFEYKLNVLSDLSDCWTQLLLYRIIPLVLVNEGDTLHTAVELQLSLPDHIEVLTADSFPSPGYNPNMELFSYDTGFAAPIFSLAQDSKIKTYDNRRVVPFAMPIFDPLFGKGRDEYARLLKRGLEWIFDYDIYQDTPGKQTLVCVFKNLKPKDAMALPSHLLVKYDQPFEITYKVKSEQSGEAPAGCKF